MTDRFKDDNYNKIVLMNSKGHLGFGLFFVEQGNDNVTCNVVFDQRFDSCHSNCKCQNSLIA